MTAASGACGWGLLIATSPAVTSHCPLCEAAPCSEPPSRAALSRGIGASVSKIEKTRQRLATLVLPAGTNLGPDIRLARRCGGPDPWADRLRRVLAIHAVQAGKREPLASCSDANADNDTSCSLRQLRRAFVGNRTRTASKEWMAPVRASPRP
jgi:hypothetical protein